MQFSTQIPIQESSNPIDYNSEIVCLGSCFAVNIGRKFNHFRFRNSTNPFGILFHPAALQKAVGFALSDKTFGEADIFFHNERWHSFDAHSDLSDADPQQLLHNVNQASQHLSKSLKAGTHIIFTLGTAWVYRRNETNNLVANCHKIPQKEFTKELLPVNEIEQNLKSIIQMIQQVNQHASIIFTVSPVRHIKDGFTENQRSKANLIAALHNILAETDNTLYFPSYEIMMDELRDYRFYAADMIHPNDVAIDYIWERFTASYIAPQAHITMQEVDSIVKGLAHRSFNPESDAHKKFLANLQQRASKLQEVFPHIIF